jgi:hypothetical protein
MKVVTSSREALSKHLTNNNLRCRVCGTQQIAEHHVIEFNSSNYGKWFDCLKCHILNFEIVRHGLEGSRGKGHFATPRKHFFEIVTEYPKSSRPFNVPENCPASFARDYGEAAKLLNVSPMASAAFSRRCLQTLLRSRGYGQKDLAPQIAALLAEADPSKAIPHYIAKNIDAVRNFGNFSAHEITNKVTAEILDVEPGEAEWSIQLVEQLIDYFYVKLVEEDRKIADLNKKLVEAGKPPILQPPTAQLDEAKIEGAEADPRQPTNDR